MPVLQTAVAVFRHLRPPSPNAKPSVIDTGSTIPSIAPTALPAISIHDPLVTPAGPPRSRLHRYSSVLAIVPHHECETWLADSLASLARSTRRLDGIVVVDDGSLHPPTEIVRAFPQVTLLRAAENVGPYRLSQEVITQTGYDAYLFQDADDWSAPTRLELLLDEAERSGAEMVGCQAYRVLCDHGDVVPATYPIDVNAALAEWPTWYALLHPTSLVSRDLVMRIGGYATGLKFGGDLEFLHRAAHAARVVNIPQMAYYKRIRSGALTSRSDTGLGSPAREELRQMENARARAAAALAAAGQRPDLTPLRLAGPIVLEHVTGPKLRSVTGEVWPA